MRPLPPGSPWIAAALLVALCAPALLLWKARPAPPPPVTRGDMVIPTPAPPEPDVAARDMFLDPLDPANAPAAEDAPRLIGIAGRLPDNAIAMVRAADGASKIVSPGQSYDGWRLESLSPDAALFSKAGRRVRSFLPAPEPEPDSEADEQQ